MTDILVHGDDWARVSRAALMIHRRGFSALTAGPGLDPTEVTRNCDPAFVVEIQSHDHRNGAEPAERTTHSSPDDVRTIVYQRVAAIDGAVDDHSDALRFLTATFAGTCTGLEESPTLQVDDLDLDIDAHRVGVGGQSVDLAATPFELLRILMSHPDQVLSKPQLLDLLYGGEDHDPNLIEAHICAIRRAIDITHPHIETVRGLGYVIRSSPRPADPASTADTPSAILDFKRPTGAVSVFPACHRARPALVGVPPRIRGLMPAG